MLRYARHSQVCTCTHRYARALTGTHAHSQVRTRTHRYARALTGTHVHSQVRTRTHRYSRALTGTHVHSQPFLIAIFQFTWVAHLPFTEPVFRGQLLLQMPNEQCQSSEGFLLGYKEFSAPCSQDGNHCTLVHRWTLQCHALSIVVVIAILNVIMLPLIMYTVSPKKLHHFIFAVTLSNQNLFR